MHVLGRADDEGQGNREESDRPRPTGDVGRFLAPDGSLGGQVAIDLDGPHVASVVGKRGSGKSYTLGVLAEELARTGGVTGVVIDPMGVFDTLAADGATVVEGPRVPASALAPRDWCDLLELDPASGPGALLWQASGARETLAGMTAFVADADAPAASRRAVENHLALAREWGVFADVEAGGEGDAGDGVVDVDDLLAPEVTVLDCSGLAGPALDAVVSAVASALYRRAVEGDLPRLPWLLVDEAHVPFSGVAAGALETLLTRGRQPGISLVLATQRPRALPEVALSQTDLLVAHRLTTEADIAALASVHPTYLRGEFGERLPSRPGEALVVDDRAATAQTIRVRERETAHGGASPRASESGDGLETTSTRNNC